MYQPSKPASQTKSAKNSGHYSGTVPRTLLAQIADHPNHSMLLGGAFFHGLGLEANVTGTHASAASTSGVGLTLVTATFGPTYIWKLPMHHADKRQWSLFGESLVGVANGLDSVFPKAGGAQTSANSMALEMGGGADLLLSRRVSLRLIQADWLWTQLPNGTSNVQNNLQLGFGVVFHLPSSISPRHGKTP